MPATTKKASSAKRPRSPSSESNVSMNEPVTKKPMSAKKRKAKSVTPDDLSASEGDTGSSIVEIIEPVPVTPVKKPKICKKVIGPLDDPVQITSKQVGVMSRHLGRRLSFGTIESDEEKVTKSPEVELLATTSSSGKRLRKPSSKAIANNTMIKALDALDAEDSSDLPERISPRKKTKTTVAKKSNKKAVKSEVKTPTSEAEVPADKITESIEISQHRSTVKLSSIAKGKRRQVAESEQSELSNGELSDHADVKQSTPAHWPESDTNQADDPQIPSDKANAIIPLSNLEDLPICTLFNYNEKGGRKNANGSENGSSPAVGLNFEAVSMDITPSFSKTLSLALNFEALSPFINLARAHLAATAVNSQNQLIFSGETPRLAISLVTGAVLSCDLISGTTNNRGDPIKRISIIPFDHQIDRFVNYLGSKYRRTKLYGPVQAQTQLTFSTRKHGVSGFSAGRDYHPVKINSKYLVHKKTTTSASNASSTWHQKQLPLQLDYEADVPIYDATKTGFAFDALSFDQLRQLPLYHRPGWQNPTDLPDNAVVTVGHTTHTFFDKPNAAGDYPPSTPGGGGQHPLDFIINFNIHFVIVHGFLKAEESDG